MSVLLPRIGITQCLRALTLLENHNQSIVGSFWLMCGYGFEDTSNHPYWWREINGDAQGILDGFEDGKFSGGHDNPLYLGFCIIVVANSSDPASLSYMIQHLRMCDGEGYSLIQLMAKYNIPAITETCYPEDFLSYRYGIAHPNYEHLKKTLDHWSVYVWEDYCSYLMGDCGQYMLSSYHDNS